MIINTLYPQSGGGGGFNVLKTAAYSASTLTAALPAKPKLVIATLRSGSIAANGMFAYASLNPETDEYVAWIQTRASGSTISWSDVSRYAVWDAANGTFSMRVRTGTAASGTCTYHAVG